MTILPFRRTTTRRTVSRTTTRPTRGVHFLGDSMLVVTSAGRLALPVWPKAPRSSSWRENARAAGNELLDRIDPT
ncbi:MAG TPA: hypothetical protein VH539_15600 [Gemmatimonadaceae bacterium]|jgi:hypothetical protein